MTAQLPPLVGKWMQDLLGGSIPEESRATCANCAMCRPTSNGQAQRFRPDTKCCTFLPHLPNYVVGGILNDTSPETDIGRASVEARIDARVGVSPLGLDAPAKYMLVYNHADDAFGRSRSLRCPHYIDEGGLCGIWRYRNSVCTTWHCQVMRGVVGREFWQQLQQLLSAVEATLELWCLEQLGIDNTVLKHLLGSHGGAGKGDRVTVADIDNESDPQSYRLAWGLTWIDREREFYQNAARLVSPLSWSDVQAIGPRVRLAARLCREAYDQLMSDVTPDRLRRGRFGVTDTQDDFVILQSEGSRDPLPILASILEILPLFDGQRSTAAVIAAAGHSGTRISEWTVQQLVDFKILVPTH